MSPSVINRRRFLTLSGITAAGAIGIACSSHPLSTKTIQDFAAGQPIDPSDGILVVVTLYGGNDGINTVVPISDPAYAKARPELAYKASEVLPLSDGLALNPGMTGLQGLWDAKELAIVRGVGYPNPDHSHFRSMAIWQSANPVTTSSSGWLGRWLDDTATTPLHAISLDPVMPVLMSGNKRTAGAFPTGGITLPKGELGVAMQKMGSPCAQDSAWQAASAASIDDLKQVAVALNPAVQKAKAADESTENPQQGGGSAGGQGALDVQLELVAAMVEMGAPVRAYSVSLGGFDTHADEKGTQQDQLAALDTALTNFQKRLSGSARGRQVVTMVYSEFGRRVMANASQGTDHGTAGPMFVMGRGVQGGFVGDQPSLTDLNDGDLKVTTDFRSVYATMLHNVLGAEPAKYLDGWSKTLSGLLA